MRANVRYRVNDGEILEANFGPVGEPGDGEGVVQLSEIPDAETHYISGGQAVQRTAEEMATRRAEAGALRRELALADLYAALSAAQARGLTRAESHLVEAINALSAL
jgi:hypothetical protein